MLTNLATKWDFDRKYKEKGEKVLDAIFSERPELRNLISFKSPRECFPGEVAFNIEYTEKADIGTIISSICCWLAYENSNEELESLTLF